MKGVENIEVHEVLMQPDLLAAFGSEQLTMFDETKTFDEWFDLCVLEPDDPRMTLDAKNNMVVKFANEAGHEIDQKYEEVFAEIIQKQGLEPKFVVRSSESTATHQEQQPEVVPNKVPSAVDAYNERIKQQQVKLEHGEKAVLTQPANLIGHEETFRHIMQQQEAQALSPDTSPVVVEAQLVSETVHQEGSVEVSGISSFEDQFDTTIDVPASPSDVLSPEIAPLEASEDAPETVQMWAEELSKEPDEVYDDFTEALLAFETTILLSEDNEALLINQPEAEMQTAPEIIGVVAERLQNLEFAEREEVGVILKNVIGAMHGLKLLEARGTEPETIEGVEAQLKELCVELFEAIGIEYSEQDIEEFMGVLMHKDFRPVKVDEPVADLIDLEHVGTREAKHSTHYAGDISARTQLKQMLGKFAVVRHIPRPELYAA